MAEGLSGHKIKGESGIGQHSDCAHTPPALLAYRRERRTRALPRRTRTMQFTSLHHHSTYSYLDGYALPEAHIRRVAELGMSSLALTEHGNMASHVKLEMAAKKEGVKPIYGCEFYTGPRG